LPFQLLAKVDIFGLLSYSLLVITTFSLWKQVEVSSKYSTVDSLKQEFYFVPADDKVSLFAPCLHLDVLLLLLS
jgi:hypothetical protein